MRSEFHITEFITVLIIIAVIILIGAVIAGMVINETNRLSEGIIVDKQFSPARFILPLTVLRLPKKRMVNRFAIRSR